MFRVLLFALTVSMLPTLPVLAQEHQHDTPPPPTAQETAAQKFAPIYPNPSCPIMGKPVSTKLFAETQKGRIYVCCKSCIKDILADVDVAYRTAYPTDKKVDNKLCPVSGDAIKEDATKVALQGFEFSVHAPEHVAAARENSQIVLAKLNDPKLVDLDNKACPVTGQPIAKNAFAVIEGQIVRLSSAKLLEEISKDPAKVLTKAKEIRAKELAEKGAAKPPSDKKPQ